MTNNDLDLAKEILEGYSSDVSTNTVFLIRPELVIAQIESSIKVIRDEIDRIVQLINLLNGVSGFNSGICTSSDRFSLDRFTDSRPRMELSIYLNCLKSEHQIYSDESLSSVLNEKHKKIEELRGHTSQLIQKSLGILK